MTTAIPQARQLTALTQTKLTSTREAQLSQTIISRPTAAKNDGGKATLNLLVEQQIQADRIAQQKQTLASNNRLNDLVAKEGNINDLQTIIAIEHQKEAVQGEADDETLQIMQNTAAEQTLVADDKTQTRDTPEARMAKEIRTKAAEDAKTKNNNNENNQKENNTKLQTVLQWCKDHIAIVVIALFALDMVVQYYCSKSLDH